MHIDFDCTLFHAERDPQIAGVGVLERICRDLLDAPQDCMRSRRICYVKLAGHGKMKLDSRKILTERRKRLAEIDCVRLVKRRDNGTEIGEQLLRGCKRLRDGCVPLLDRGVEGRLQMQAQRSEMVSEFLCNPTGRASTWPARPRDTSS
jgi:hypothetical protein